jgi:hypothetical protein
MGHGGVPAGLGHPYRGTGGLGPVTGDELSSLRRHAPPRVGDGRVATGCRSGGVLRVRPAAPARRPGPRLDCNFFNLMNSIIFVLFDKYCLIVDQLGSKDSSRGFQLNCVISYFLPTFTTSCIGPKINVMKRE